MQEWIAQELIAKANQAILESQWLRREGRSLRLEAAVRASELGETILQVHAETNRSLMAGEPQRSTAIICQGEVGQQHFAGVTSGSIRSGPVHPTLYGYKL